jgi:hypothetical protein
MQLNDVRQSCFSAATKSQMLLNLWGQLYHQSDRTESSEHDLEELNVYYKYYRALGIVENLDRMGQRISPELAKEKELCLYHSFPFTAWLIGGRFNQHLDDPEMIVQMDDCSVDILLDPAIPPYHYVPDKRFGRWWVYPRNLINDQKPPEPITEDFLMNLMSNPVMFDPDTLLSILAASSCSKWLSRETDYWLMMKIEDNAINPRPRISW